MMSRQLRASASIFFYISYNWTKFLNLLFLFEDSIIHCYIGENILVTNINSDISSQTEVLIFLKIFNYGYHLLLNCACPYRYEGDIQMIVHAWLP